MRVILLNGPPRVGKDSAQAALPGYKEKLSWPLKWGVCAMYDPNNTWGMDYFEDHKDEPLEQLLGKTYREQQISLFNDWFKPQFGTDVLGRMLVQRLKVMEKVIDAYDSGFHGLVTVSDSGRPEECKAITDYFGPKNSVVVQISRKGYTYTDYREPVDLSHLGIPLIKVSNNIQGHPELFIETLCNRLNELWPGTFT